MTDFNNLMSNGIPVETGLGVAVGEVKHLVATEASTDAYCDLLVQRGIPNSEIYSTLATAEAALTTNRNDTIVMHPGDHTATAAVTWDLSNSRLIGAHSPSPWSNSTKITFSGDAAALSPLLTVSGSDNYFRNIHFVDDCGHVDHHNFLTSTGSGNMFEMCWFEGPTDATQGTDTSYSTVAVDGGGNYFKNCVFGTTAHGTMNGAAQVSFSTPYRSTFDSCIFYMHPAATTGRFLYAGTSQVVGAQFFRNCMFVSHWTNAGDQIAQVFSGAHSALDGGMLVFDANCVFIGCDAVSTGGATQFTYVGHPLTAAHVGANAGIILRVSGANP